MLLYSTYLSSLIFDRKSVFVNHLRLFCWNPLLFIKKPKEKEKNHDFQRFHFDNLPTSCENRVIKRSRKTFMKNMIILDQDILAPTSAFEPFALTDTLTEFAGENEQPFLHFWQLPNCFILGMKDTRVTDLAAGIEVIKAANYQPVIRNAGGLGVIADAGILNVSLIVPKADLSIDGGYELMTALVKTAFPTKKEIIAKEIADSYCPGKFDLSIEDLKFAGIAQRRIKNGIAVMMYLSVTGNQLARGEMVKEFYQASLKERFSLEGYPAVRPASMENLPVLLGENLTVLACKERFLNAAEKMFSREIAFQQADKFLAETDNLERFQEKITSMQQRNLLLKEL